MTIKPANLQAAGMIAPSIIQPLTPKNPKWQRLAPVPQWVSLGYVAVAYQYENFIVISAVEVAADNDGIDRGPEYHVSISKNVAGFKARCDSNDAQWILSEFGLVGAEEDNHVPHGIVRNFWRTVSEPLIGLECACKADEPVIREDKGDFIWRPHP